MRLLEGEPAPLMINGTVAASLDHVLQLPRRTNEIVETNQGGDRGGTPTRNQQGLSNYLKILLAGGLTGIHRCKQRELQRHAHLAPQLIQLDGTTAVAMMILRIAIRITKDVESTMAISFIRKMIGIYVHRQSLAKLQSLGSQFQDTPRHCLRPRSHLVRSQLQITLNGVVHSH
jgi:hypothetical protein